MNKKYFDFIETTELSKSEIAEIEKRKAEKLRKHAKKIRLLSESKVKDQVELKHVNGKVIISIDLEGKNSHTFSNGDKIYIGRQFNNLNRRETEPVNAIVISADKAPAGVEILIHPNAIIDTNKIFGYREDETDVRYYSIPEEQCYLWKNEDGDWQPFKNFVTGERVYEPYAGSLVGIEPKLIPNVLYITSGHLKGKVCHTLKACDYEIIFMGSNGKEQRVIRCRHYEDEYNEREEIVGIDDELTKKVMKMDLLVGISPNNAKYIIFTV